MISVAKIRAETQLNLQFIISEDNCSLILMFSSNTGFSKKKFFDKFIYWRFVCHEINILSRSFLLSASLPVFNCQLSISRLLVFFWFLFYPLGFMLLFIVFNWTYIVCYSKEYTEKNKITKKYDNKN